MINVALIVYLTSLGVGTAAYLIFLVSLRRGKEKPAAKEEKQTLEMEEYQHA
jgi:hypothetical protein